MFFFESAWGVVSAFICFALGILIAVALAKKLSISARWLLFLYIWHTFFCYIYMVFVVSDGGDALMYYKASKNISFSSFSLGTESIVYITGLLTVGFGFSFLGSFLFYNIIGFVGVSFFYASLKWIVYERGRSARILACIISLLPSLHFWTSAVGKDSVAFLSASLALWSCLDLLRRYWLMAISILIMLLVRPHIAGFIIISLFFMVVFSSGLSFKYRLVTGLFALIGSIYLIPLALSYVGVADGAGINELVSYLEQRQTYNLEGGGALDISTLSLPEKLFAYLYRPLPFEARSMFQFASSMDNFFFLALTAFAIFRFFRFGLPSYIFPGYYFIVSYVAISWIVLALVTANMGISARQKWMFLPMFLFLMMSFWPRAKKEC